MVNCFVASLESQGWQVEKDVEPVLTALSMLQNQLPQKKGVG
jgi:hypothetical protein